MLYIYITSAVLTFLFMLAFKKPIKELELDDTMLAILFVVMLVGFSYFAWACIVIFFLIKPIGKILQKYYIGE